MIFIGVPLLPPAAIWWLRSPNASNSTNFCNVNSDGSANYNTSGLSSGLAPAFILNESLTVTDRRRKTRNERRGTSLGKP